VCGNLLAGRLEVEKDIDIILQRLAEMQDQAEEKS